MDDATPEESKPKGIKPANLTAIIIAAVAVALSGIGGGYAYWTHHESTGYHAAVEQAGKADKALMKAVDEATATTYKAISSRSRSCWTSSTTPSGRRRRSRASPRTSRASGWRGGSPPRRLPVSNDEQHADDTEVTVREYTHE